MAKKKNVRGEEPKPLCTSPIPAKFLKRGRKLAMRYPITIEPKPDGEFGGVVSEKNLTILVEGKDPNECFIKARRTLVEVLAFMLEAGQTPSKPTRISEMLRKKARG